MFVCAGVSVCVSVCVELYTQLTLYFYVSTKFCCQNLISENLFCVKIPGTTLNFLRPKAYFEKLVLMLYTRRLTEYFKEVIIRFKNDK